MKRITLILMLTMLISVTAAYADGNAHLENEYPNTYVNTGNWAEDIIGVAMTQIGYSEKYAPGGADIKPNQDGGYTKYGAAYNNPYAPWCTYFILWCAREADVPNSVLCSSGACGNPDIMVNWFKNTGCWHGREYIPQRGDVVFFDIDGDSGADHAGLVSSVSDDHETIYTIEGNCGGYYGYTTAREVRFNNIMGYGAPRYYMSDTLNARVILNSAAYSVPGVPDYSTLLWSGTELEVLCSDGDYYLARVPYYYSGGFRIFYIKRAAVRLEGSVIDAQEMYSIGKRGRVIADSTVKCRASEQPLRSGASDATVRSNTAVGTEAEILFEENGFYFIRTQNMCGYIEKLKISMLQ